jgi:Protein of unknown function (DUF4238)
MIAHRHHVLSRCYLKHFAVHRKKKKDYMVHVFDRKNRKQFQTATENVAVIRDFNRVEIEGHPPDVFEKAMAGFEDELAPALQRIIDSRSLKNADDRAFLLNFIALLALRNPRLREDVRGFHERIAKIIMDLVLATPERWAQQVKGAIADGFIKPDADVDYAKMKQFVEEGQFRVEVATHSHVQLEMGLFDKVLPLFFQRRWWLMKAPQDSGGFITSDHPLPHVVQSEGAPRNARARVRDAPNPGGLSNFLSISCRRCIRNRRRRNRNRGIACCGNQRNHRCICGSSNLRAGYALYLRLSVGRSSSKGFKAH